MEQYQRGRSPSAGTGHTSMNHSRSPSAQNGFNQQANARGLDPLLQQQSSPLSDGAGSQNPSFPGHNYARPGIQQNFSSSQGAPPHQQYLQSQDSQQQLGQLVSQHGIFQGIDVQNVGFDQTFDPTLLNLDQNDSLNNFDFDTAGSTSNLSPASAEYSSMTAAMQPTSMPSDVHFPQDTFAMGQTQPSAESASRNQSLSPSSAAHPLGQAGREWAGMTPSFRGHRRNQSDAYSEISSSVAHHSPFVDPSENFDVNGTSPLMNGHNDPNLPESLGMGTFTLSDTLGHPQHVSPGHSSHPSPHVSPQTEGFDAQLSQNDGLGLYPQSGQVSEEFPGMGGHTGDYDSAQHLEAPEISIQFAPERQPSFNESGQAGQDHDALSPPIRGQSRPRGRAISDPYSNMSRSSTPNRNRAPSLSLHPHSRSISRSSSPGGPPNGVQKPRDRASSTSAVPAQREKLIGLADSDQFANIDLSSVSSINGSESGPKRTQKHPATFQCTLCPKRFTRAYNLRSHLRTHTDERPFVCTVCGKAFARQHDRKRHEGLHSGEKKFVCKGLLAGGSGNAGTWGCGRRFARADALGRHFRSEAGRACIKPLLDEEARERRAAMMDQQSQDMMNSAAIVQPGLSGGQGPMPSMSMGGEQVDVSGISLPAALLAQYPALAGIQWDTMPPGGSGGQHEDDDYNFDHSGRSSFDASSGGELDFDDDAFSGNEESWSTGIQGMSHVSQQQAAQGTGGWSDGYAAGG